MADIRITDQTISVLQKSLDLRAQKQEVIAGNIANAETPGYSARKFDFEDSLRKAINTPETAGKKNSCQTFPHRIKWHIQSPGNHYQTSQPKHPGRWQ